jgi:hypothetical protein
LARQLAVVAVAVVAGMTNHPLRAQGVGKYLAPQDQVIAIRAGQLFDSRSGSIRNNQVVLITGDRITDVGAAVEFPIGTKGARPELGDRPGMIDTDVHVNTGGTKRSRPWRGGAHTLGQLGPLLMIGPLLHSLG